MTEQLYKELGEKIDVVREALKVAEEFADKHGLILHFDVDARYGTNTHYIPDVDMDQIKPYGPRDYQVEQLKDLIEYYGEDSEEEGIAEYNRNFRGQWVSSSAYCP